MTRLLETAIDIKIPFHDVDMMSVTWHGHYVKYFEIARCALLDRIGFNYNEMAESGYVWPVVDLRIRYPKPTVFGQVITVIAAIVEYEHRLKIDYKTVDKQSGKRLTKGYTVQVAVDISNKEMRYESPEILKRAIEQGL